MILIIFIGSASATDDNNTQQLSQNIDEITVDNTDEILTDEVSSAGNNSGLKELDSDNISFNKLSNVQSKDLLKASNDNDVLGDTYVFGDNNGYHNYPISDMPRYDKPVPLNDMVIRGDEGASGIIFDHVIGYGNDVPAYFSPIYINNQHGNIYGFQNCIFSNCSGIAGLIEAASYDGSLYNPITIFIYF